jgi:hypothetical protein
MLYVLFLIAAVVLGAGFMRPPKVFWQKAVVGAAALLMLAVLVAFGIEAMMQAEAR